MSPSGYAYKGVRYRSLRAAAEAHGLDYKKVWSRLRAGKSPEIAFSTDELPKTGKSEAIIINGIEYSAVSVAAREFGVNERTVHGRLKSGLTPEQAVGIEPFDEGKKVRITVNNETFPSIAAAARHFGIPYYSVNNRLKRGRSIEEAFSAGKLKRKSKNSIKVEVEGLKFDSLADACSHFEIDYKIARYRIRKNWSLEQVFGLAPAPENTSKTAPKTFHINNQTFHSMSALASAYGIRAGKIQSRLASGWSLEEALEIKERLYKNKPLKVNVEGREFENRNEAARFYGINKGTVSSRMNNMGWSLEQALEIKPPPEGFHTDFGAVYMITNHLNGRRYIGITLQNPPIKRFEQHIRSSEILKERKAGSLAEAIFNDGAENFEFKIIGTEKTKSALEKAEKTQISQKQTLFPDGYNLSKGGNIGKVPGRSIEIPSLGLKFKTVADAARHFNIDASAIIYRLNKGYEPEQCVGLKPLNWSSSRWKKITIDGMNFLTVKDAATHFGNDPHRVRCRIRDGWDISKAVKTPVQKKGKTIIIDGIEYPSHSAAARALGISPDAIRWHIKKSH